MLIGINCSEELKHEITRLEIEKAWMQRAGAEDKIKEIEKKLEQLYKSI